MIRISLKAVALLSLGVLLVITVGLSRSFSKESIDCQKIQSRAEYLNELAEQEDAYAQFYFAEETKDYPLALKWYKKAAEQGVPDAYHGIATLYYRGDGVPQDFEEAYFWASLAAKLSNIDYTISPNLVEKKLSVESIDKVKKRIFQHALPVNLKPKPPFPLLNIPAILCGAKDGGCELSASCGNIVGVSCGYSHDGNYFFIEKENKKIISSCNYLNGGCKNNLPKAWTCEPPKK